LKLLLYILQNAERYLTLYRTNPFQNSVTPSRHYLCISLFEELHLKSNPKSLD